ncbi:unnamed protein product [Adineta steineri]|uniref:SET domain-containing protein n=2 Tax=Adineta steineri TaxID=433720 RepID=A0A820BA08_9BILA|nr:unnamed protein product [Adineta steineri]
MHSSIDRVIDDPQSDLFVIKLIPGKGYGMFAKRDLQCGTVIVCEKPLMKFPNGSPPWLLEAIYDKLDSETQRRIRFLSASKPWKHPLDSICETNSIPLAHGSEEKGVFYYISMVNHSCESNTFWIWFDYNNKQEMKLIADRRIKAGEELVCSYIERFQTRQRRHEFLQYTWLFKCQCHVCEQHEKDKELDEQYASLSKNYDYIMDFESKVSEEHIKRFLKSVKFVQEHYHNSLIQMFLLHLCILLPCCMLKKWEDALKYAKKAIFLGRMIYDDDYERYLITVKDIIMAKVPMKHRIGFDKYLV